MRTKDRIIFGSLAFLGLLTTPYALACTTDGWDTFSGTGTAASPPTAARYSEFCALRMTNTGHVQDNSPSHTDMIARFYVLPQLTGGPGTATIFAAYAAENGTGKLLDITWNGTLLSFNPTGGSSATFNPGTGWSLIEISYNAGGASSFWVDADAESAPATGTFTAAVGTVESVRLGLPEGLEGFTGGNVNFDAYESHATTPVGPLLKGDGNGNGAISIADVIATGNELNGNLAAGQPDCNENGAVTIADVICIGNLL